MPPPHAGFFSSRLHDLSIVKRLTASEVRKTVEALVNTPTRSEAAERLGVSRATLYRRLQDPRVLNALEEYYTTLREELTRGVLHRVEEYLRIQDELLASENETVKLRLFLGVLQYLLKLPEVQKRELDEVIDDLDPRRN